MKYHRLNELLELLQHTWQKEPDLNLMELIQKLATESGYHDDITKLTDDMLIYQLKMRDSHKTDAIPGLLKDYEPDFKTAILRARGILKD